MLSKLYRHLASGSTLRRNNELSCAWGARDSISQKSTWLLKSQLVSPRLYLHMKKSCEPWCRVPDYFLNSSSTVSSSRAALSYVESISARYCRFMIMLSAPGSWWASAIPTPAYVRMRVRVTVAQWHTCMYPPSPGFHQTRDLVIYRDLWTAVHPSPRSSATPPRRSCWLYPISPFPRPAHLSPFPMKWTCSFPSFWIFIVRTRGLNRISPRKPRLSWLLVDLIRIFDWSTRVPPFLSSGTLSFGDFDFGRYRKRILCICRPFTIFKKDN